MAGFNVQTFLPSSISGLAGLSAGIFLLWYTITSLTTWYRLRHIPGPFLASFSYLWMARNLIYGRQMEECIALKKYGSIVQIGPNYVVTDDPAIIRRYNNSRKTYPKDSWYTGMRFDQQDHMGSIIDTAAHDKIKAKLAHGYSGRDDVNVDGMVDVQVSHLIDTIRRRHLSTKTEFKPVDACRTLRYFTLDVITRLAYGEPFGFLDAEDDLYNYTDSVDRFLLALALGTDLPSLRWIMYSPLMRGLLPKATDNNGVGKVIGIAHNIIKERFEKGQFNNSDMVGAFMRHGVLQREVVSESMLTILAGSDTTATAIRTTMLYIMATARVYSRLKNEIREAVVSGSVSSPITVEQAKQLPYLQAVIHEGFRMRPPALYGHYKVVPPEGDTFNGIFIPGGTAIGHNAMAMMRNEKIFGDDADLFRPERFLESSDEKKLDMERTIDLGFGTGRWMCAGKNVVQAELNKTYFELLRNFDFQLINPAKAMQEASYFVVAQSNMWVSITEAS